MQKRRYFFLAWQRHLVTRDGQRLSQVGFDFFDQGSRFEDLGERAEAQDPGLNFFGSGHFKGKFQRAVFELFVFLAGMPAFVFAPTWRFDLSRVHHTFSNTLTSRYYTFSPQGATSPPDRALGKRRGPISEDSPGARESILVRLPGKRVQCQRVEILRSRDESRSILAPSLHL